VGHDGLKKQATKKAADLAETGISLELLAVGNPDFDLKKFYIDLLPDNEFGDNFVNAAKQVMGHILLQFY
jgi:hypothetical protein